MATMHRRALLYVTALVLAQLALPLHGGVGEAAAAPGPTARPPIVILGDSMFTPAHGVVSGSGTAMDPYVISGWVIDGDAWSRNPPLLGFNPHPPGIYIEATNKHVVIRDNVIHDNPTAQVWLADAANVRVEGNDLAFNADSPPKGAYAHGVIVENGRSVRVANNAIALHGRHVAAMGVAVASLNGPTRDVEVAGNHVASGAGHDAAYGVGVSGEGRWPARAVRVHNNTVAITGSPGMAWGVDARASPGLQVTDNALATTADGPGWGVLIRDAAGAAVQGNAVEGFGAGVEVRGGSGATVAWNAVTGGGRGVVLNRTTGAAVANNTIQGAAHGFGVLGRTPDHYTHEVHNTTTVDGRPVRYLQGLQGVTVDAANMSLGYLALVDARNVTVTPPGVSGAVHGLLVARSVGVTVDAGVLTGNQMSVEVAHSERVRVTNLTGHDALLRDASWSRVDNATLEGGAAGVTLSQGARWSRVENATIRFNGVGVRLEGAGHARLANLTVAGNSEAGVLAAGADAVVRGSSFTFNGVGVLANGVFGETHVDARHNWWGDASGPSGDGPGAGDAVEATWGATVEFAPWLTAAP